MKPPSLLLSRSYLSLLKRKLQLQNNSNSPMALVSFVIMICACFSVNATERLFKLILISCLSEALQKLGNWPSARDDSRKLNTICMLQFTKVHRYTLITADQNIKKKIIRSVHVNLRILPKTYLHFHGNILHRSLYDGHAA